MTQDDTRLEIAPLDIIFSCSVCQATFSEIYSDPEYDKGFRDSDRPEEHQQVTKLWLTKCGHLTCTKHLDGGGVPFHRAGEQPQATCPVCASERNDDQTKPLYAIRGSNDGQHDAAIPKSWFDAPPINLDGRSKDMDALRFHYLSLIRFGTKLLPRLRSIETALDDSENRAASEASKREKVATQLENAESKVNGLQKCEEQLNKWKQRESRIRYYLGLFVHITKENDKLREQLTAMGYAVPSRRYDTDPDARRSHQSGPTSPRDELPARQTGQRQSQFSNDVFEQLPAFYQQEQRNTASDRTLSGHFEPNISAYNGDASFYTTRKRTRDENSNANVHGYAPSEAPRAESRDLMPPPPPPVNRKSPSRFPQNASVPMLPNHGYVQPLEEVSRSPPTHQDVLEYGLRQSFATSPASLSMSTGHQFEPEIEFMGITRNPSSFRLDETGTFANNTTPRAPADHTPPVYVMSGARKSPFLKRTLSKPEMEQFQGTPHQAIARDISRRPQPLKFPREPDSQKYWNPMTPSPNKRQIPVPETQSVISPFFSRSGARQHSGRVTLPPKSSAQSVISHEHFPSLETPYMPLPTSRTGTAAAPNITYPGNTRSQQRPAQYVQYRQNHSAPRSTRTTSNVPQQSSRKAYVYDSQPPSSPYFQPHHPSNWLAPSRGQEPPDTSRSRLITRQVHQETPTSRVGAAMNRFQADSAPLGINSRRHVTYPEYDDGYERTERVHTSTGLKSGVSRLSNEWGRESREPRLEASVVGNPSIDVDPRFSRTRRTER